ncbi:MAG TPA: ferric reductase-like transmembrane domain-containing protein, partial [Kofleriaceae bacterium]|nr:ferric reductase-like transmembrane domain-containing protein [Kofleriaceae bacterium]
CGIVPAILLVWDAYHGNLGVNGVNYAIRSTGMLGLVFLTLSLAITPIRRLTKWNILISARRNLGVYGFVYILSHFLIFFWWDRDGDIADTLSEIIDRPYLWYGFGALLLMVPLVLTSTDGMVTRLGPKRWKALHRLSYVAVLGGVIHFYLLVKADTSRPFAFSVAFGALMLFRIVDNEVELRREVRKARSKMPPIAKPGGKKKFWSGELLVARIFQETHDVRTFRFVMPDGGPLPFDYTAGQYMNLKLVIGGKRVNRSYTISSSPTRSSSYIEISVKRAGNGYGSHHMHDSVKEGDRIKVSAPAGKFVFAGAPADAKRIVMLAGGVGITPMMSITRALTDRSWPGDIYLIFAVRKKHDIIFDTEIRHLEARFPNLHVCVTLSGDDDGAWTGKRGRITRELVTSFVPDLAHGPIMMCGPEGMMKEMRALLVGMGIPDAEILEEVFVSPPTPSESDAVTADAMAAADAVEDMPAEGEPANVRFQKSDRTCELTPELTVLEAAEECGVTIPFECRSGICGQCKTKLVSGRVVMEVQDALTSGDRAKGLILACQAKAVKDVVVDA